MRFFSSKNYKKSKWYHKYIGLMIIFPLIWMSISGILINHKELISDYTVPNWLTPSIYNIKNFNRSAIIDFVNIDNIDIFAGKKGIFLIDNNKIDFFSNGLNSSVINRKIWDLHYLKNSKTLFAATEGGLYYIKLDRVITKENLLKKEWKNIKLDNINKPIKKIVETDDKLFIFTDSDFFRSNKDLNFKKVTPKRDEDNHVTMIELFFHLHDGSIWGTVGKVIFDISGFLIIFLSISAFYIWFIPARLKKKQRKIKKRDKKISDGTKLKLNKKRKLYRFFKKHHNRVGIHSFFTVIIISFTAIFMRPPLIVAITDVTLPDYIYPATRSKNSWNKRIENALYDKKRGKLLVQCSDGIWSSNSNLKELFTKENYLPYFIMGASYFEEKNGDYIVGSFSGLYRFSPDNNKIYNIISKKEVDSVSRTRPKKGQMITAYFNYNDKQYIATHIAGLLDTDGKMVTPFEQPKIMNEIEFPLWNWMFELHNGRIFKGIIGKWYIIFVPLLSIFFFLMLLSGIYDYIHIFKIKKRQNR